MKNIHTESTVLFEIREDSANGDIVGTGHGLAVPYGTETKIGGLRESFAPEHLMLTMLLVSPWLIVTANP